MSCTHTEQPGRRKQTDPSRQASLNRHGSLWRLPVLPYCWRQPWMRYVLRSSSTASIAERFFTCLREAANAANSVQLVSCQYRALVLGPEVSFPSRSVMCRHRFLLPLLGRWVGAWRIVRCGDEVGGSTNVLMPAKFRLCRRSSLQPCPRHWGRQIPARPTPEAGISCAFGGNCITSGTSSMTSEEA